MSSSVTDEGLILRPLSGLKDASKVITIEYGTNKISTTTAPEPSANATEDKKPPEEVECHGLVGLVDLVSSAHLIVITQRQQVAQIRSKAVYAVRDVTLISLTSKAEAEKGLANARKSVARQGAEPGDAAAGGKESGEGDVGAGAGAETEGEGEDTDVEVTDHEGVADEKGGGQGEDGKPAEAEALEAPKQGILKRGTGVAKGVVTSPVKVGRFAGKWFGRGGGAKAKTKAEGEGEVGEQAMLPGKGGAQPVAGGQPDVAPAGEVASEQAATDETTSKSSKQPESEQQDHKKAAGQSVIESLTPRILRGARLYFASSGFFFSYEHDISGALTQRSETVGTMPLWKRFDAMFFWNRHLLAPLINAGLDELVLPLLQGFVGQRAFSIEKTEQGENDVVAEAAQNPEEVVAAQATPAPNVQVTEEKKETHEFLLTLISRRSTKRAGLRYRRRGIDDEGSVANFVETEQILSTQSWGLSDKAFSLLQIRGSIPLFFNQSPYSFKPQPIPFGSEATNHAAFTKHFAWLHKRYQETQVVSLVDKGATEVGIGELYGKHVQMANNGDGIEGKQIGFEWFDFHNQCKGMRFENVSILLDTLQSKLDAFGWIVKQNDRNVRLQKGVVRTNCMDCLDRSNVVQSALAGWALEKQLAELGLQIDLKKDPKTQWFNTLWADNGDYISKQYAGTAALKGDFTRTRKRNWTGALSDFSLTLTRYYNNVFGDYFMQACIDYYLGKVGPSVFEEFEADMMSQDYALDMRRIRRNGIETCVKIVLEDPTEVLKAGWTLSCPKEANTLRTLPFEECVLLLTDKGLYFCRFDWDTEKVGAFERVDLRDVVAIWRGAYVTSALGPTHLDEEKNVGFAVRYKTSDRAIVRRNTRSLRNEEEAEDENAGKDELEKQKQPEKDETRMLAFKALPPQASASKGVVEDTAELSEKELVMHICSEAYNAMAALRMREGESQDDLPGVEEKDVISAAEARKATGYMESIGYSLKRLVWS